MSSSHPELELEQAHVNYAYRRLAESREEALRLKSMVEVGAGGTNQARWEREVFYSNIVNRLRELDLGNRSLCFGRIDQTEEAGAGSYHIGRVAVMGEAQESLMVDWRAPVAEAFYQATGASPRGLVRRRHFSCRGSTVLDLEDEFFGEAAHQGRVVVNGRELRGVGSLVYALEENRSGKLSDIIGTIQAEQDEIIRAELPGVLVVQGGPGTGKTVVALHRAAYLLYTHRFPLEDQGVLVVGPNRLFLGYIEQVLPALGEAGVELAVLADLISAVRVAGRDEPLASRTKGSLDIAVVLRRALRDRQRRLREDLVVGIGARKVRLTVAESETIIVEARRRYRTHNAARKFVESQLYELIAAKHPDGLDPISVREQLKGDPVLRAALLWMWPRLSPAQFLHDLYGSEALIASAAGTKLTQAQQRAILRPWQPSMDVSKVIWSVDDVPVLDEAEEILGTWLKPREVAETVRTYGHIVVDEAQDLSPMQLRMLTRRSLNGSMTIVGDIAQSTGAWAHNDWQEILEHLPDRRPARMAELTVGYRIPEPMMRVASRVLKHAAADLVAPVSVRSKGDRPRFIRLADQALLIEAVVETAVEQSEQSEIGNVAIISPASMMDEVVDGFAKVEARSGVAPTEGLSQPITIVPVNMIKGLEVDVAILVEPARVMEEEIQPARSLYVACTRATKRLFVLHSDSLPFEMSSG